MLNIMQDNYMKNKFKAIILIILFLLSISMLIGLKYEFYSDSRKYLQEYSIGQAGIKGALNAKPLGNNAAYAIGANKYGYPVFKSPDIAFEQIKKNCSNGLSAIQKEYFLLPISRLNFRTYGKHASQLLESQKGEYAEQINKIALFIEIYENSFN